jgi:hypothetical protein
VFSLNEDVFDVIHGDDIFEEEIEAKFDDVAGQSGA